MTRVKLSFHWNYWFGLLQNILREKEWNRWYDINILLTTVPLASNGLIISQRNEWSPAYYHPKAFSLEKINLITLYSALAAAEK